MDRLRRFFLLADGLADSVVALRSPVSIESMSSTASLDQVGSGALLCLVARLTRHHLLLLRVLVVDIHELSVGALLQVSNARRDLRTRHMSCSRLVVGISKKVLDFKRWRLTHLRWVLSWLLLANTTI